MSDRASTKFRPVIEALEAKQPLTASPATAPIAGAKAIAQPSIAAEAMKPNDGYLVFRVTNPTPFNDTLKPPFNHVLVQTKQPVPGQKYNILFVSVQNGTAQTFNASSGFTVKFPGQKQATPILTGSETWKPGQVYVVYVLTKKYYPLPSQTSSGFAFVLGGASSIAIPGPSGIFVGITYHPNTFNKTLDSIVAYGSGAQGGAGVKYGLPDTAIYEFVSSKTNRKDFGGYF